MTNGYTFNYQEVNLMGFDRGVKRWSNAPVEKKLAIVGAALAMWACIGIILNAVVVAIMWWGLWATGTLAVAPKLFQCLGIGGALWLARVMWTAGRG